MRNGFIVAILLALVAAPTAFAGTGFCRAMPCCPPHLGAALASMQHPDCCNAPSCEQPPAVAGAFTTATQMTLPATAVVVAVIPLSSTIVEGEPLLRWEVCPSLPPPLQRRIALLSLLLI